MKHKFLLRNLTPCVIQFPLPKTIIWVLRFKLQFKISQICWCKVDSVEISTIHLGVEINAIKIKQRGQLVISGTDRRWLKACSNALYALYTHYTTLDFVWSTLYSVVGLRCSNVLYTDYTTTLQVWRNRELWVKITHSSTRVSIETCSTSRVVRSNELDFVEYRFSDRETKEKSSGCRVEVWPVSNIAIHD